MPLGDLDDVPGVHQDDSVRGSSRDNDLVRHASTFRLNAPGMGWGSEDLPVTRPARRRLRGVAQPSFSAMQQFCKVLQTGGQDLNLMGFWISQRLGIRLPDSSR